jgi:glycosyltransferase involved in cell wall biosynthesis
MPKVRVYLLTYRRNHLLPRALQSLLAQTFTDWVCELHNDDPADPIPAKLAAATTDPRIRMRQHEQNLGANRTFNLVFGPAAEPYVCLLEDDNWWQPDFLEKLVALADAHPEAGFVWSNQRIWQETPAGGWEDTGRTTAKLLWPDLEFSGPTLFHWPQPQQRFDMIHYNGSALFRSAEAGALQLPPRAPQAGMEVFRDRALRWPGLFVPDQLVNFSWTISTFRELDADTWFICRALFEASFLRCSTPQSPDAVELWRAASSARPSQAASLLLHAWLAGRLGEFAARARWHDWLGVVAHLVRHPRSFWRVLRAKDVYPELWAFLLEATARRFAESAAQGITGWGPRRPVSQS